MNNELSYSLEKHLSEIALDEELILANLIFDPKVVGKILKEKHFTVEDFQGTENNRILLETLLEMIDSEESLTLANVIDRLKEKKKGTKTALEWIGIERVEKLFTNPFLTPGVRQLDDLEPVIDRIRDRNIRNKARRILITYSEKITYSTTDAYETLSGCIQDLRSIYLDSTTRYIRDLSSHIRDMQELVNNARAKKYSYSTFETNFPLLQERLSGFHKEYYLIAGGVGMGKSTFCTQLAWDLVNLNPSLTVMFFTLDLNKNDVIAKMIAQSQEIPIDYVRHPFIENQEYELKRLAGIELLQKRQERLLIIDESEGRLYIEDIKKLVRRVRLERGGDLAVIIDPLFKIHFKDERIGFFEKCNQLSSELKSLCATEKIILIATAGLPKAISNRRPKREDLQEIMGLLYDPYVIFFIYCDYLNDFETPFLEWDWGKDNFMIPISEIHIVKNKMGPGNNRIFYRYYEAYAKYKECAPQEVENYTAMIENIQKFKEDKALKENAAKAHKKETIEEDF